MIKSVKVNGYTVGEATQPVSILHPFSIGVNS